MLYAIVALVVIIIDQWVKYWVAGAIPLSSTGEAFIPGIVSLVNLHNDGAAFGFLSGGGARIYFIILTGVFTVAVILALATKFISGPVSRWSIVLVTAGGLSNCLDRVIYGYVQDMFKFEIGALDWFPIFNVADIVITMFCVVFILALFLERSPQGDDEFAEDDEDEDRPVRQRAEVKPAEEKPEKPKKRRSKHDDEYEQYKAARAARQRAEAAAPAAPTTPAAPKPVQPAQPASDPFAEWERANARAGVQASYAAPVAPREPVKPAPVPTPAPAPAPAAPAKPARSVSEDFSLDDILNEFK